MGSRGQGDLSARLCCDAARWSRISQHDDIGVLTKERLQRRGEGHADLGTHEHLIDSNRLYSTGSSAVMMLTSMLILEAPVSVVVLPEPVGPVTSTIPYSWIASINSRSARSSCRTCPGPGSRLPLSNTENDFLAEQRQEVETRKSITGADFELDAPSCGRRSAMFRRMILKREMSPAASRWAAS